jgi:hypothetical protein
MEEGGDRHIMDNNDQQRIQTSRTGKGGPKTHAGKAAVRLNALTHGLTAQQILLPDEDRAEFEAFRESVFRELNPRPGIEAPLVELVVNDLWRLRRAVRCETDYVKWRCQTLASDIQRLDFSAKTSDLIEKAAIDPLIVVVADDIIGGRATEKLTRYRTTIENGVYRTLRELRTWQQATMTNRGRGSNSTDQIPSQSHTRV